MSFTVPWLIIYSIIWLYVGGTLGGLLIYHFGRRKGRKGKK